MRWANSHSGGPRAYKSGMTAPLPQGAETLKRGLDANRRNPAEVIALMRVLREMVADAQARRSLTPMMTYLYESLDAAEARVAYVPVACHAGCAWCCHGYIAATAPEVIHVVKGLASARVDALKPAAAAMFARTGGATHDARAKMITRCPLLGDDNLCSVYATRPNTCRTHMSTDDKACERVHMKLSGEDVMRPVVFSTLRRAYHVALAGALKHAGLSYKAYEYYAALHRLLNEQDVLAAEAEWLAGKDILEGLPPDIGGELFDDPTMAQVYAQAFP